MALLLVEGLPVVARAQDFHRGHAGQPLAGAVPHHHTAVCIDHEGRHHQMLQQSRGIVVRRGLPVPGRIISHQATAATSPEEGTSSSRNSALGLAPENRKPCIWVHPSARSNSFCCGVSTPSATVVMLQEAAMFTTACTMTDEPSASVRSVTKQRSILILSKGKRLR